MTIREVLLEGSGDNNVRVIGNTSDDKGLDSLRFSVNGFHQFTSTLFGKESDFDLVALGQQPGQGQVELIAFDNGGNFRTQTAPFEIHEPSPTIDGKGFLVENGEFNPAEGKQFCVEEVCDEIGADGSVLLEGLPWKGSYQIHFIEGANPEFLVVPSQNRLSKNLVNFINADARAGRVPVDTALVDGVNERRYIFFADNPVSMQEIVDNHTGWIPWDQMFLLSTDMADDTLFGFPGEKFKFTYSDETNASPVDTITLFFQLRWPTDPIPQEMIDSVEVWSKRGIKRAQNCWGMIWDEPELYELKYDYSYANSFFYSLPGNVVLFPNRAPTGWEEVNVDSENPLNGVDRIGYLGLSLAYPWGMRYLRRFLEGSLSAIFSGSPHFAFSPLNSYMSKMDEMGGLDVGWTAIDQQACIFLSAYDHKTRFTLSPGYQ